MGIAGLSQLSYHAGAINGHVALRFLAHWTVYTREFRFSQSPTSGQNHVCLSITENPSGVKATARPVGGKQT